jgi:hypothetical protein
MNECETHRGAIDDVAAGGAASPATAAHLGACAACAKALADKRALLDRIDGVAREWMAADVPPNLSDAVMARVRKAGPSLAAGRATARIAAALVGVAAAAAVIVLALTGTFIHRPQSAAPTLSPPSVLKWRSPTAVLAQPTESVLEMPRLLDVAPVPHQHVTPGGNHAG